MAPEIIAAAEVVWKYMNICQPSVPSDLILVLGSRDQSVATWAAELYLQGMAPKILFSGGLGRFTKEVFVKSEADLFAELAIQMGVNKDDIIIENKSTNTGQNIEYSYKILVDNKIPHSSIILIQKPYMLRRSWATFKKQWPETETTITMSGRPVEFMQYCQENDMTDVINAMVGDLQRIPAPITNYPSTIYPNKHLT